MYGCRMKSGGDVGAQLSKFPDIIIKDGKEAGKLLDLRSIHTGCDATHYDADQIWFVGISAMRAHRVFSWMRHNVSEMKKSIFDATLCFRTVDKVTEVRQKNGG